MFVLLGNLFKKFIYSLITLLNFSSSFTIEDAIKDLKKAFDSKLLIDPLNNIKYYNIKLMNNINLK